MSTKDGVSKPTEKAINLATAKQLVAFMERANRIYDDIADAQELLKDLWSEAKGVGFDAKELNAIVKLHRKDPNNEKIKESVRDVYMKALQLDLGPLGNWARNRDVAESKLETQALLSTADVTQQMRADAFAVSNGLDDDGEAAARLKQMVREDGGETCTVSINGGPEVSLDTLKTALKRVKGRRGAAAVSASEVP